MASLLQKSVADLVTIAGLTGFVLLGSSATAETIEQLKLLASVLTKSAGANPFHRRQQFVE